jgi:hypothetical protein
MDTVATVVLQDRVWDGSGAEVRQTLSGTSSAPVCANM